MTRKNRKSQARQNPAKGSGKNRQVAGGQKMITGGLGRLSALGATLTRAYFDSLVNPFEYGGAKLGWGCMSPSFLASGYLRGSVAANADGTLLLIAVPNLKQLLYYNNAGAAVATMSYSDASDAAAVRANTLLARPISIGIKAFPSIAATSPPGIVYSGDLQGQNYTALNLITPNDAISFPQGDQRIASLGASATGRPVDPNSFSFSKPTVDTTGYAAAANIPFTCPYIVFTGLPASAVVAFEVVVNFECLPISAASDSPMGFPAVADDKLSSHWPSFEQMWAKVQPYLPSPGQVYDVGATAVASYASTALGRLAGANPQSNLMKLLTY